MDQSAALAALAALGQDTRLSAFRALVRAEPEGMLAGELGAALGLRQNTLSTHLGILLAARLVQNRREGRGIRYRADLAGMQGLLAFLMQDCCGGRADLCAPATHACLCEAEAAR